MAWILFVLHQCMMVMTRWTDWCTGLRAGQSALAVAQHAGSLVFLLQNMLYLLQQCTRQTQHQWHWHWACLCHLESKYCMNALKLLIIHELYCKFYATPSMCTLASYASPMLAATLMSVTWLVTSSLDFTTEQLFWDCGCNSNSFDYKEM